MLVFFFFRDWLFQSLLIQNTHSVRLYKYIHTYLGPYRWQCTDSSLYNNLPRFNNICERVQIPRKKYSTYNLPYLFTIFRAAFWHIPPSYRYLYCTYYTALGSPIFFCWILRFISFSSPIPDLASLIILLLSFWIETRSISTLPYAWKNLMINKHSTQRMDFGANMYKTKLHTESRGGCCLVWQKTR